MLKIINRASYKILELLATVEKKAAIKPISHDLNNQWNEKLKDAERKLSKVLLKEEISKSADSEFQESIKKEHPNSYVEEKDLVEKMNLKLKRLLEERWKKKWHKFRNRVPAPEKRKYNNLFLSDYVENALNRTKGNGINETISKKRKMKLWRRAMILTNSGIPLLKDSNDKHSSSLSINKRNQLLGNELGLNESACISSTVDSIVDLDNGSIIGRDEMVGKGKET